MYVEEQFPSKEEPAKDFNAIRVAALESSGYGLGTSKSPSAFPPPPLAPVILATWVKIIKARFQHLRVAEEPKRERKAFGLCYDIGRVSSVDVWSDISSLRRPFPFPFPFHFSPFGLTEKIWF